MEQVVTVWGVVAVVVMVVLFWRATRTHRNPFVG